MYGCMHKVLSILGEASNLLCFISLIIVVRIVEIVIEDKRTNGVEETIEEAMVQIVAEGGQLRK
jgi:hypothetical protein